MGRGKKEGKKDAQKVLSFILDKKKDNNQRLRGCKQSFPSGALQLSDLCLRWSDSCQRGALNA